MADKEKPTQRTEKGLEIPVPERDEFIGNLHKVAKAGKPSDPGDARGPVKERPK